MYKSGLDLLNAETQSPPIHRELFGLLVESEKISEEFEIGSSKMPRVLGLKKKPGAVAPALVLQHDA
jgi:hypothetical protein